MASATDLDAVLRDLIGPDGASSPDAVVAAWSDRRGPDVRLAVTEHRLEGAMSDALRRVGEPPDQDLEAVLLDDRRVRLLAMRALGDIAEALTDAGVPWLVFKGPAIARLMQRPELRTFNDIDLLVDARSFPTSVDALLDAGAVEQNQNWEPYHRHRVGEVPMAMHGVTVDLHWHVTGLGRERPMFRLDPAAMLERRETGEIGGRTVPLLDPVDQLIHLCVHAALGGGSRLDQLRDVAVVVDAMAIDWDLLVERASAGWVEGLVGHLLDRARRVAGAGIPEEVVERLAGSRSIARRRRLDGDRVAGLRAVPLVWWRHRRIDTARAALRRTGERVAGSRHRGWDFTDPRSHLYRDRPTGGAAGRARYFDAVVTDRW